MQSLNQKTVAAEVAYLAVMGFAVISNSLDESVDFVEPNGLKPVDRENYGAEAQALLDAYDPLPDTQATAKNAIDQAAGETRARYITVAPGQDAVYALKLDECKRYAAAGYPEDLTGWDFVAAEAAANSCSGKTACDEVLFIASQWSKLAAGIEMIRRGAIAKITSLTDVATIEATVRVAINQLAEI